MLLTHILTCSPNILTLFRNCPSLYPTTSHKLHSVQPNLTAAVTADTREDRNSVARLTITKIANAALEAVTDAVAIGNDVPSNANNHSNSSRGNADGNSNRIFSQSIDRPGNVYDLGVTSDANAAPKGRDLEIIREDQSYSSANTATIQRGVEFANSPTAFSSTSETGWPRKRMISVPENVAQNSLCVFILKLMYI